MGKPVVVDVTCCEDCPCSSWRGNPAYPIDGMLHCDLADIAASDGGLPAPERCPLRLSPAVIYLEEGKC